MGPSNVSRRWQLLLLAAGLLGRLVGVLARRQGLGRGGTRLYSCPSAPKPRSRRRIPLGVVGTFDAVGVFVVVGVVVGT